MAKGKMNERIDEVANALTSYEWSNLVWWESGWESQHRYCAHLLGVPADSPDATKWVPALEQRFREINAEVDARMAAARASGEIDW